MLYMALISVSDGHRLIAGATGSCTLTTDNTEINLFDPSDYNWLDNMGNKLFTVEKYKGTDMRTDNLKYERKCKICEETFKTDNKDRVICDGDECNSLYNLAAKKIEFIEKKEKTDKILKKALELKEI